MTRIAKRRTYCKTIKTTERDAPLRARTLRKATTILTPATMTSWKKPSRAYPAYAWSPTAMDVPPKSLPNWIATNIR